MVVEGKWTGRITEQLYKFIRDAVDYIKGVTGFESAHPAFKASVAEVEAHIEAARAAGFEGPTLRPGERQGDLLSRQNEDLRLVGQDGTDHGGRQQAQEASAAARAQQERQQGTLFAPKPEPGRTLREVGSDFPHDDVAPKLIDVRATNLGISQRAATVFQSWPETIKAADGSTVTLNNPERGSLAARARHLVFDNTTDQLNPAKAAWLSAVPDTLQNAAARLVDPVSGNRVYVREYQDGTKHMVVVEPDGRVAEQKPFTGSLITQFPKSGTGGRQDAMKMDWVRPGGERTGLQQPASGPTPAGSNEGTVSPRPAFRKDPYPRKPPGQDTLGAATPETASSPAFPDNLYRGGSPEGRKAQLLREAYATGELTHDPETGLWSRGSKTALVARHLVDANHEQTLAEQRTELDSAKDQIAGRFARANNPQPMEKIAPREEAALSAKEEALARFRSPHSAAEPASPLSENGQRAQDKIASLEALQEQQPLKPQQQDLLDGWRKIFAEEQAKQPRTFDSVSGERIDANHTAFSPDSGTLDIPRDQMPQVAAEHRGAMTQFLQARGMDVSAQDELPGSLKPSQAEFNPGKVAKAGAIREAGDANPRRILTSSDGHVIDGHHQWLDRLANTPGETMPTLKINAPARDILSQIHEFPSAGMEKAPDIAGSGGDSSSILGAAVPELADDAEHPLFAKPGTVTVPKKGLLTAVADKVLGTPEHRANVDAVSAGKDAVDTMAGVSGRQAKNAVRMDISNDLDRQAAGPVVEAGGDRRKLTADLRQVQESPDKKLARQHTPIYQHALDNFDRLNTLADGYRQRDVAEDAAAERAGLTPQAIARMKHIYEDPTSPSSTIVPDKGFGATKGYKTAADAIAAGVDPKSTDLGDLAEKRVAANQKAINSHLFQNGLADLRASDGKPVIGGVVESSTRLNPDGTVSNAQRVPQGYEAVQAGSNVLTVHKEFAPLMRSLYGESAIGQTWLGNKALDVVALAKHGTAILDTYHAARVLTKEVLGFQTIGYDKGLAALDYSQADRPRAVAAGKISQSEADWANNHEAVIQRGLKAGLNVGKVSDNLLDAAKQHNLFERLPVVGKGLTWANDLIFHKLTRGAMTQAFTVAAERNAKRFPELGQAEIDRRSARELNEFFGNLGSQGLFKSKTMQDAARMIGFAPQWTESQFRAEARGYGQAARAGTDALQGKGFRVGVVAQAMMGTALASIVASQALNMFTRGKPTWQNEEEGHRWDAWLPGGPHNRGFWFSPLEIAAEYAHQMGKHMAAGEGVLDSAANIAANKLSGPARAAKDLVTGQDSAGRPFGSMRERLTAAATDALPFPIPFSGMLAKDPKSPTGYGLNHQPGSLEKQGLGMAGLKVDSAASPRSQMYRLAQQFKPKGGGAGSQHAPSEYSGLRQALDNQDRSTAEGEIRQLLQDGKSLPKIAKALGLHNGGAGGVEPEHFTGSKAGDQQMFAKLTAAQKATYRQAQADRGASARLFAQWAPALMSKDADVRKLAATNLRQELQEKAASESARTKPAPAPGILTLPKGPRRVVRGTWGRSAPVTAR